MRSFASNPSKRSTSNLRCKIERIVAELKLHGLRVNTSSATSVTSLDFCPASNEPTASLQASSMESCPHDCNRSSAAKGMPSASSECNNVADEHRNNVFAFETVSSSRELDAICTSKSVASTAYVSINEFMDEKKPVKSPASQRNAARVHGSDTVGAMSF